MSLQSDVKAVLEAALNLATAHLSLAQSESTKLARVLVSVLVLAAMVVPMLVVAWAFFNVALALLLQRWLSTDASFFAVGIGNLVLSALAVALAALRLKHLTPFEMTAAALKETRQWALGTASVDKTKGALP
jgi:Putative Actinobacterial Holin-X, holin superfamily III